ncbi:MFS general substrate transporter [Coniochaeta ligniaria NRRL 30616]|uniref:MFS general substrate transporter n=1 Tax=Coniochaeta ligniaria NRRL 30616 TaxID=1408157 RepID=A0A1J7I5F4_9PEZI|nr:MFS general substrate transporter [Coniochaeta ligniaria NRRL 30616]
MAFNSQAATIESSSETSPLLKSSDANRYGGSEVSSISSDSSSDLSTASTPELDAETAPRIEDVGDFSKQLPAPTHVAKTISILLIGILVAEIDGSIVMATHPLIASEFNDLANSTWLITGFALAGAVTQPLYGKLSDIYGRKAVILLAYSIFALGWGLLSSAIVGLGQSMWQVILGRVISGAGSSGMTVLVSILITDLVPIRDVAQWRSWVNIAATTGRSLGGPLGGWLADVIGWRWSFLGQTPVVAFALILCAICLPASTPKRIASESGDGSSKTAWQLLHRIDFRGAFLFGLMILAFLVPAELGGDHLPWGHPIIISLFASSIALLFIFIAVERRTEEPIIPLEIFHNRDAVLSYIILGLQGAAQIGMMFSVPLYFQITARTSNAEAGAHLFPAVAGNCIGGLLSGVFIKRSGRYKILCTFATISSSICYLLLMLRWHGNTNWLESLYIMPGGFGTGIAQSALFISLQAVVNAEHMAPAVSMMYLSTRVCMMTGLVSSSATMRQFLRIGLKSRLDELGLDATRRDKVIAKAISDVGYVGRTHGTLRQAVVGAYVDGLWYSHETSGPPEMTSGIQGAQVVKAWLSLEHHA